MAGKRIKIAEDEKLRCIDDIIAKKKGIAEVAFALGVSSATIRNWVNARKTQIATDTSAAADYILGEDAAPPSPASEPGHESRQTLDLLSDRYTQSERYEREEDSSTGETLHPEWPEEPAAEPAPQQHPEQAPDDIPLGLKLDDAYTELRAHLSAALNCAIKVKELANDVLAVLREIT